MKPIIKVNKLTFGYNDKIILENVNWEVNRGDFVGILGSNGSGKSTLMKLLLRILSPIDGEIQILGENIERFKQWEKIGYVPQKANAFNTNFPANVEEIVGANIIKKRGFGKVSKEQGMEAISKALSTVGMLEYRKSLIGCLSGGQQQRVFIARALVNNPEILFLDEPTVGIDIKSEDALYCLLAELNQNLGLTIIMVSHDISALTVHAGKLVCMGNKKLIFHDAREELSQEFITELYGHDVKLHLHQHQCKNCLKARAGNVGNTSV